MHPGIRLASRSLAQPLSVHIRAPSSSRRQTPSSCPAVTLVRFWSGRTMQRTPNSNHCHRSPQSVQCLRDQWRAHLHRCRHIRRSSRSMDTERHSTLVNVLSLFTMSWSVCWRELVVTDRRLRCWTILMESSWRSISTFTWQILPTIGCSCFDRDKEMEEQWPEMDRREQSTDRNSCWCWWISLHCWSFQSSYRWIWPEWFSLSGGMWESAWCRIHSIELPEDDEFRHGSKQWSNSKVFADQ